VSTATSTTPTQATITTAAVLAERVHVRGFVDREILRTEPGEDGSESVGGGLAAPFASMGQLDSRSSLPSMLLFASGTGPTTANGTGWSQPIGVEQLQQALWRSECCAACHSPCVLARIIRHQGTRTRVTVLTMAYHEPGIRWVGRIPISIASASENGPRSPRAPLSRTLLSRAVVVFVTTHDEYRSGPCR
jgi:hypothetical protein